MPDTNHPWMKIISDFFRDNPTRQFLIRDMPLDAAQAVAKAGLIVGAAASRPNDPPALYVCTAQTVPCIVSRGDGPSDGTIRPGVLFLDGGIPLPEFGAGNETPTESEERIAAGLVQFAALAAVKDQSLIDFLSWAFGPKPTNSAVTSTH